MYAGKVPTFSSRLLLAARALRRPVALVIAGTGLVLGVPLGRLLHERPWRGMVVAAPARTMQTPVAISDKTLPQPPVATVVPNGLPPAEAEARRVVEALLARYLEWQEKEADRGGWTPLPLLQEALALGAREDVELILEQLIKRKGGSRFTDLVLCGWADRDPEAAWDLVAARMIDPRSPGVRLYGVNLAQFTRRMAHHHWPLMEPLLKHPADGPLAALAAEAWTQRMLDAPDASEAFKRVSEAPEGRVRELVTGHLFWYLGPRYPEECIAFLAEVPEAERLHETGALAVNIAKSHPDLALKLVSEHPLQRVYTSMGDDYSAAEDVLEFTMRRQLKGSLALTAQLLREGREMGHSGFFGRLADFLPQRMGEWLPGAVEAAQGWSQGGKFLAGLVGGCPWNEGVDGAKAISAIEDPSLRAVAAGAWAQRWGMAEPEAARAWVATLPPESQAIALWTREESPQPVLAACTAAKVMPKVPILEEMARAAPEVTLPWLAAQPEANAWQLGSGVRAWAEAEPAAAAAWAAQTEDAEMRVRLVTAAIERWAEASPAAAEAWLSASPLTTEDREFVSDLTGITPP